MLSDTQKKEWIRMYFPRKATPHLLDLQILHSSQRANCALRKKRFSEKENLQRKMQLPCCKRRITGRKQRIYPEQSVNNEGGDTTLKQFIIRREKRTGGIIR